MRKDEFRAWLSKSIKKKPAGDCISRCSTVEASLNVDLDEEFKKDGGNALLSQLSYNRKMANKNEPYPACFSFREGANVVQRMTDYRSATKKYFAFCEEEQR